jgi:hypothetical protein
MLNSCCERSRKQSTRVEQDTITYQVGDEGRVPFLQGT